MTHLYVDRLHRSVKKYAMEKITDIYAMRTVLKFLLFKNVQGGVRFFQ
jgi:hypothetical protein